jgi:transposase-like protein
MKTATVQILSIDITCPYCDASEPHDAFYYIEPVSLKCEQCGETFRTPPLKLNRGPGSRELV